MNSLRTVLTLLIITSSVIAGHAQESNSMPPSGKPLSKSEIKKFKTGLKPAQNTNIIGHI